MNEQIPEAVEIADSVIYQKLQGEVVVLNMADQTCYALDDVGATMWQTLLDHKNLASTAVELEKVYQADPGTLRRDLDGLVSELIVAGLLRSC
jgi:hypothetical protein